MAKQYDLQIREGNNKFWEEVRKTVKLVEAEELSVETLQKRIKINDDYLAIPQLQRHENGLSKIFKEAYTIVLNSKLKLCKIS